LLLVSWSVFCQNDDYLDRRVALVIGNADYDDAPLKNPINDANAVTQTLKGLDFEVSAYTNLNKVEMKKAIYEFEDKLSQNPSVALFYFAGHGLQLNGNNYLVPVNSQIDREWMIEDECISANSIMRMLGYVQNPMNIMILDACRNNPYSRSFRSLSRGLAEPGEAPSGTIVGFATSPGNVASDGDGDNGLYTQELIRR
jgi:uncharacterized caspase-like protein